MVEIHPIKIENSLKNISYVIESKDKKAICIDPTNADMVENALTSLELELKGIINTHEHFDHIQGNEQLSSHHNCFIYCHNKARGIISSATNGVEEGDYISIDDTSYFYVLSTPGHAYGHICLVLYELDEPKALFSGDTLFNAGVGNCHGGNVDDLYESVIGKLNQLSHTISIYPGHDYISNNLQFAKTIEEENSHIDFYLKKSQKEKELVVLQLQEEHLINPFLRLNSLEILSTLKQKKFHYETQKEVFKSLRKLRDRW